MGGVDEEGPRGGGRGAAVVVNDGLVDAQGGADVNGGEGAGLVAALDQSDHAVRGTSSSDGQCVAREGAFADLVVVDPGTVADTSTYGRLGSYAVGVRDVLVNGQVVVRDGTVTTARPGRRLARKR